MGPLPHLMHETTMIANAGNHESVRQQKKPPGLWVRPLPEPTNRRRPQCSAVSNAVAITTIQAYRSTFRRSSDVRLYMRQCTSDQKAPQIRRPNPNGHKGRLFRRVNPLCTRVTLPLSQSTSWDLVPGCDQESIGLSTGNRFNVAPGYGKGCARTRTS